MKKELNEQVKQTEKYVHEFCVADSSGHDWWHIFRRKASPVYGGLSSGIFPRMGR
jgi:hypothetical protein